MADFSDFVASKPSANQAEADVLRYTEMLMEALTIDAPDDYAYAIDGGRKFHKVWMSTESGNRSIHAFVDKKTGEVYKAASTKAPAKGVRYNLLNPISREQMFERAGWNNGYLYIR